MVDVKTKYNDVMTVLREEIVSGVYGPGHRLPTRNEMGAKFGVGMATVQKALTTLEEEGFVNARASSGTFVAERLPHLCNYGLVIHHEAEWSRFYAAVRKAVSSVKTDEGICFREYRSSLDVDSRGDVAQLCRDVVRHRLAGLIFTSFPSRSDLKGTPAMDQPGFPRVAIHGPSKGGLPTVYGDLDSFLSRGVEYLCSRGRRRIAHLRIDYGSDQLQREFEASVKKCGVEVQPYWFQAVTPGPVFNAARNLVRLLMQLHGDDRPNGLIIHDDNLIEHTVAGLMAAGVKVPDDLEVVVQCNFPASVPSVLPLVRLGFDFRRIIAECLRVLTVQREGRQPPMVTKLPAMFEDELAAEVQ